MYFFFICSCACIKCSSVVISKRTVILLHDCNSTFFYTAGMPKYILCDILYVLGIHYEEILCTSCAQTLKLHCSMNIDTTASKALLIEKALQY